MEKDYTFLWSDNWYIENNKAWFVDGYFNILSCLDLESNECTYVAEVPSLSSNKFRQNPRCIKIDSEIFCMPDLADSIWVYNLENLSFNEIKIKNQSGERLSVTGFWKVNNKLFVLSVGLKKMIEIDIKKKSIDNYYILCDAKDEMVAKNVRVGMDIYFVSAGSNQIYQFNLESRKTSVYTIPKINDRLYAISYDGCKFWLSGYHKKIYIWDKKNNSTEILENFPKGFGVYDFSGERENILDCEAEVFDFPAFIDIEAVGQHIWFIPFQTNEILYVDKDTYQIDILEMKEEKETKQSLSMRHMETKYLMQYVTEDSYIGLFSLKNNYIVEINTVEKNEIIRKCSCDYEYLKKIISAMGPVLNEKNRFEQTILKKFLKSKEMGERIGEAVDRFQNEMPIGVTIHRQMQ